MIVKKMHLLSVPLSGSSEPFLTKFLGSSALCKQALRHLTSIIIGTLLPISAAMSLIPSDQLFINFSRNIPTINDIVTTLAFFIGCFFIFRALLKLKIYGEMRTMMAPNARLNQVLIFLFAGALLMYLKDATMPMLVDAVFGSPTKNPLAYDTSNNMAAAVQLAAKHIIQFIGLVSLVRGIMQLTGQQEGGRSPMGKAITHIIAGVFAINVQQSINLVQGVFEV